MHKLCTFNKMGGEDYESMGRYCHANFEGQLWRGVELGKVSCSSYRGSSILARIETAIPTGVPFDLCQARGWLIISVFWMNDWLIQGALCKAFTHCFVLARNPRAIVRAC